MPPFISSKGFSTFKKFLDNKENYSADGLISLLTCIPKMTNFDEFKTECINEGFVAAISNVLISTEFPQVVKISLKIKTIWIGISILELLMSAISGWSTRNLRSVE